MSLVIGLLSAVTACSGGGANVQSVSAARSAAAQPQSSVKRVTSATLDESAATATLTGYDSAILNDHPLSYYRMNDVTKLLHDFAPNPRHGNHGSAEQLGVSGLTSMDYTAAAFPGGTYNITRFANVLPDAKLQPTIVSVEAWVEASSLNASGLFQPVVAYGRLSTGTPYQIAISPINQFVFSVHTATANTSVVSNTLSAPGRVFHIVGTYDGTTLKIYVNGVFENQTSASGAITYAGIYSWTGLAIGSGYDALTTHPIVSYAGTIADVSIYGYGLTATQVENHYLDGVLTPRLTEKAASADAFVDSIGVNAPFNYQGTSYDSDFSTVSSLLVSSGIRHIRAGFDTTWTTYYTRMNELAAAGIKGELVMIGNETASEIKSYETLAANSIEAFEGPNEPDLSGNVNWLADTRSFMKLLYGTVKGDATLARFPVVGPSVVEPADEAEIGNISADLDYGNIHPYYGPNNPGTTGTGSITPFGRSGSVQYYVGVGQEVSGTKPMIASETGFSTGDLGKGNVSELCDGKEAPRTYFEHFLNGITRTLTYQFVESGTAYGALGSFSYMGLVRQNLTPKPSYTAIKSLISLLSDKGAAFSSGTLTYTLRGDVNNLAHLLMQKRDGTYYLALWLEVPSWDETTNTDISATPQSITVNLPSTVKSGTFYTLGNTGSMSGASWVPTSASVTVPVADRISVLTFHP
jgi:hypothetical protein